MGVYYFDSESGSPLLAQMLRKESDVSEDWTAFEGAPWQWSGGPVVYNDTLPPYIVTEDSWGTLAFAYSSEFESYAPTNLCSYFTNFCATVDSSHDCDTAYSFPGTSIPYLGQLTPLQVLIDSITFSNYFSMPMGTVNPAGLAYLSATYRIDGASPITLGPGQSNMVPASFGFEAALQTETPTFRTIEYHFDGRQFPLANAAEFVQRSSPPVSGNPIIADGWMFSGGPGLSSYPVATPPTNTMIVAQVGRPVNLQSWRQVMAVNSEGQTITNQTYWIDEDFNAAYLCNSNTGDVVRILATNYNGTFRIDTNDAQTGILSPSLDFTNLAYGNAYFGQRGATFTPTQPGKVIVTTMLDSNGFYGEVTIYVIDMQVDANHDGIMDNRDLTGPNNPMPFWVNNDYDRGHSVDCIQTLDLDCDWEEDDLGTNNPQLPQWSQTPDWHYWDALGNPAIPSLRDLEDYTRLWMRGLTSLMSALPTNYGAVLQWRNNTGVAIRLFRAAEDDGGTDYLTDTNTASLQTNYNYNPYYGFVSPGYTVNFSQSYGSNAIASDYFIFCGAVSGQDELVLQVTNDVGGVVGEASIFLNLKDIKLMYERWTVGDRPNTTTVPYEQAELATNGLPTGTGSFTYSADQTGTTPYILFVHGWNMTEYEKDRFAETAYKRLYWQGYQGRFGLFRWPTPANFPGGEVSWLAFDPNNFDISDEASWLAGAPLRSLLVNLDAQYPNRVYMFAHSHGNMAAGEALRTNVTLVQTYVAMQAAVAAYAYNPFAPLRPTSLIASDNPGYPTPNRYADYWTNGAPCYFNAVAGAANYVNFFNPQDWALNWWKTDQDTKPDFDYGWYGSPSETYYHLNTLGITNYLSFPTNTYTIFSYISEGLSWPVGQQANVGGVFAQKFQVDLSSSPYNFGDTHKYHSGEFRSNNMLRGPVWQQLLQVMGLQPSQ